MNNFYSRRTVAFAVVCLVALAAVAAAVIARPSRGAPHGGATSANSPKPCGVAAKPPATYSHVIWILLENKAYTQVVGARSAPYINSLAKECGLATHYYAISHPSLPNYIALTSGSTQGITDDNDPSAHAITSANIFSQLRGNWQSLEESMPSNCRLFDSGDYAVRHNPAAYFTNLRDACGARDVPLPSAPHLSARFTLITPNVCNDMHSCPISTGDTWLSSFLPKILHSSSYLQGGAAVFITWDEADYTSNYSNSGSHVPTLVISPTTPAGTRSPTRFTHYSLLRTTEEMLGLRCLAAACRAASMRSAFHS